MFMSNHSGLKYFFGKLRLNARKSTCLSMLGEFDFEIKYMKGKGNKVDDALRGRIHVNHLEIVSSYTIDLEERIKSIRKQDEKYQKIKEMLWKNNEDKVYHLTEDELVRFKGRICVHNSDEIKRIIMKEFHVKPYSSHARYQ